jgi:REP element-mobilizing transposase RayT
MAALRRAKRPVQLTLDSARRPSGQGGWRPGAGRPRGRAGVAHDRRPGFPGRYPQHVTLRVAAADARLRRYHPLQIVRGAISAARRPDFRVIHFHVLANHLHFVIEADGAEALSRGMQGFTVRLARGINRVLGRRGALFADRYHARALRSPREVRNALRYVLLNGHHHAAERGERQSWWADPYSSGAWFDGWRHPLRPFEAWQRELLAAPRPTAAPQTWLLTTGWRRCGPLWFDDPPGAARQRHHT